MATITKQHLNLTSSRPTVADNPISKAHLAYLATANVERAAVVNLTLDALRNTCSRIFSSAARSPATPGANNSPASIESFA